MLLVAPGHQLSITAQGCEGAQGTPDVLYLHELVGDVGRVTATILRRHWTMLDLVLTWSGFSECSESAWVFDLCCWGVDLFTMHWPKRNASGCGNGLW